MKRNFIISDLIAFEGENFYYDIHNCYSFKTVEFENDNTQLSIVFEKVQGDWVKEKDPQIIKLQFEDVIRFETSPNFFEDTPKDVGEMAYKESDDFDYDTFIPEEHSTEQDDFILRFTSGEYIRVSAESIRIMH